MIIDINPGPPPRQPLKGTFMTNNLFIDHLEGYRFGFYHKTQGGFFRAYNMQTGIGYGPFLNHHEAIQWLINQM